LLLVSEGQVQITFPQAVHGVGLWKKDPIGRAAGVSFKIPGFIERTTAQTMPSDTQRHNLVSTADGGFPQGTDASSRCWLEKE
jgi:hypothetical protein